MVTIMIIFWLPGIIAESGCRWIGEEEDTPLKEQSW